MSRREELQRLAVSCYLSHRPTSELAITDRLLRAADSTIAHEDGRAVEEIRSFAKAYQRTHDRAPMLNSAKRELGRQFRQVTDDVLDGHTSQAQADLAHARWILDSHCGQDTPIYSNVTRQFKQTAKIIQTVEDRMGPVSIDNIVSISKANARVNAAVDYREPVSVD